MGESCEEVGGGGVFRSFELTCTGRWIVFLLSLEAGGFVCFLRLPMAAFLFIVWLHFGLCVDSRPTVDCGLYKASKPRAGSGSCVSDFATCVSMSSLLGVSMAFFVYCSYCLTGRLIDMMFSQEGKTTRNLAQYVLLYTRSFC